MARQEINTFYQRLKTCGTPTFEVKPEGSQTVCRLTLPAVNVDSGAFGATSFTASGKNKKVATAQAAELGLAFLQQQPAFQALKPSGSLWDVISKLLTPEVLRKEPEFEGHVLLAQKFNDGWLPLQLLATARPVTSWAKQHLPQALQSPEAFLTSLHQHIQSEACKSVPDSVELEAQKRAIRRRETYAGREGFDIVTPLLATIDRGIGKRLKCVLIPADDSLPVREISIEGGGHFWNSLAAALAVSPADLLYWDKFGASQQLLLEDAEAAEEIDDPGLFAMLAKHFGPLPKSQSSKQPAAAEELVKEQTDSNDPADCYTEVRPPAMYSSAAGSRLNRRASFLLRKKLHGNALVSYCRLRACEWRTPSVKWASVPLPIFSAWAAASLPARQVAAATSAPLLAALPHTFRSPKAWTGPLPSDLLQHLLPIELSAKEPSYTARPLSDDPDAAWECAAITQPLGEAEWLAEASDCENQQAATQQIAVQLLHRLDGFLRRLWASGTQNISAESNQPAVSDIEVPRPGEGDLSVPGGLLEFKFSLQAAEGRLAGRVIASGTGRTCWGSGDISEAVSALISTCKPGGSASCTLQLPVTALVPGFAPAWPQCKLQVDPEPRMRWIGVPQANGGSLFDPPLSTQRCERMARLLGEAGAASVVDVGCGDGRLVEYLATKAKAGGSPVRSIVGLDISLPALKRGATRLCTRNPGLFDGPAAPTVQIYHIDAVCEASSQPESWGALRGVDAAILQEVVEHLDPAPLAWLGPCLLGALRPGRLLVTTPNREYNQLLHSLQPQGLMPNGLRNSDHRFEWTRAEFQEWGNKVAHEHGYSVSYQDLGSAKEDSGEADIGLSTQVAVFARGPEACTPVPGAVFGGCLVFDSKEVEEPETKLQQTRERDADSDFQASQRRRVENGEQ